MHAKANESPAALLPCPFCGGAAAEHYIRDGRQVSCAVCRASGAPEYHGPDDSSARASKAWNRRASTAPGASESRGSVQDDPRCGDERYELDAYIWRRDSTQEWVLELSGTINDCFFISRHAEPLTTNPEDVAGLPSLYDATTPPAVASGEPTAEQWRQAIAAWGRDPVAGNIDLKTNLDWIERKAHELARSAAAKGEG